ncbi:MAG: hypothetical protein U1F35_11370 [Steroidobacteraceae bacterium]
MSRPRKLLLRACAALLALCAGKDVGRRAGQAADSGAHCRGRCHPDESPVNPRYVLLDAHGRMVGNEDFPGRFQLITFGTLLPGCSVRPRCRPWPARYQALGPLANACNSSSSAWIRSVTPSARTLRRISVTSSV